MAAELSAAPGLERPRKPKVQSTWNRVFSRATRLPVPCQSGPCGADWRARNAGYCVLFSMRLRGRFSARQGPANCIVRWASREYRAARISRVKLGLRPNIRTIIGRCGGGLQAGLQSMVSPGCIFFNRALPWSVTLHPDRLTFRSDRRSSSLARPSSVTAVFARRIHCNLLRPLSAGSPASTEGRHRQGISDGSGNSHEARAGAGSRSPSDCLSLGYARLAQPLAA